MGLPRAMKPREVLLALAFALALLGAGVAVAPPILMGTINTAAQFGSFAGTQGVGLGDEVLNYRYVTSWAGDGSSEDITANAGVEWKTTAPASAGIRLISAQYEYVVIDTNRQIVDERIHQIQSGLFPQKLSPGQIFLMGFDNWVIVGPVVGTLEFALSVQYEVCETFLPGDGTCTYSAPRMDVFVRDTAILLSGAGDVQIKTKQPVGPGANVVIAYTTGIATDEKGAGGWILQLLRPSDRQAGGSEKMKWGHRQIGNLASGTASFVVTPDMVLAGSDNRYQVRLKNTLLGQSTSVFVVLGDPVSAAPPQPEVSYTVRATDGIPRLGTVVTLAFHGFTNPITEKSIEKYDIAIIYNGGSTEEIETPNEEFVFRTSEDTSLRIEITSFDGSLTSAPSVIIIDISPVCATCIGIPSLATIGGLMFYTMFVVLMVFGSLLIWWLVPLHALARILLALAFIIIIAIITNWIIVPAV